MKKPPIQERLSFKSKLDRCFLLKHTSFKFTTALLIILFTILAASFKKGAVVLAPEEELRLYVISEVDSLLQYTKNLSHFKTVQTTNYKNARKHYKRIEFFVEYYSTFHAKYLINGPLVPKHEIEFGQKVYPPQGFQVIEENLFGNDCDSLKTSHNFFILDSTFSKLKNYYKNITLEKSKLTEAIKLQFIRVMAMNLNGYDCTINQQNITETIYVFEGLLKLLQVYEKSHIDKTKANYLLTRNKLLLCLNQLKKNTNNNTFNRLQFITKFANPAYVDVKKYFQGFDISPSQVNYAFNLYNNRPFSISEINTQHFALYRNDTVNSETQAKLGEFLFFDPVLSGNNERSCASCHQPAKGFTDGLSKSFAFNGKNRIMRNSPSLLNAAYQKLYFYDGRLFNLEEQAGDVLHNTFEMNLSEEKIVEKLRESVEYKQLFRTAFKGSRDSVVTFYGVMKAIAEYIRTLKTTNSRFDKYLAGDYKQLSPQEINGYNIFSGKALCGSCHFFPVFNGTVPPFYNDNEFEVLGVPETDEYLEVDSDLGRKQITRMEIHKYAFKTPGIRNISTSAPYMHNGVLKTIDDVLDFYNKGGGTGFKLIVPNQTLPFDSLNLSKNELNDIKAFLYSLDATASTKFKAPVQLPKFNNKKLDARKIGGVY
jgi:cytochrome c peroxidase